MVAAIAKGLPRLDGDSLLDAQLGLPYISSMVASSGIVCSTHSNTPVSVVDAYLTSRFVLNLTLVFRTTSSTCYVRASFRL